MKNLLNGPLRLDHPKPPPPPHILFLLHRLLPPATLSPATLSPISRLQTSDSPSSFSLALSLFLFLLSSQTAKGQSTPPCRQPAARAGQGDSEVAENSNPSSPAAQELQWHNGGACTVIASNSDMKQWFLASFDCGSWSQSINFKSLLKLVSSISNESAQIFGTYFCAIENFTSRSKPNEALF